MLEEARRLGFLGPGPVEAHLDHAEGFASAIASVAPGGPKRGVDLGSGGGVPGLALAVAFPATQWLLVDAAQRRTAFLRPAVEALEFGARVEVATVRAEELGRQPTHRAGHDVVVARGFGAPSVTAECAAPLLDVQGWAVISEPPDGGVERWPVEGLALLGMTLGPFIRAGGASFQILEQPVLCPGRYPRRVGVPAKRRLF